MKQISFKVGREEKGAVLIDALASHLALSRKKCKALLDARNVLVNERRIWMARHQLSTGDRVEVIGIADREADREALKVLFEDERFLVVDKPAGMVSNGPRSVEQYLREELGQPELAAAHRLDKDTSGCLLIARDATVFEQVVAVFRARGVHKQYRAIIAGCLRPPERRINTPVGGAQAVTHVKTLDATREASHLMVKIETGRTHQIRRHLAGLGHPVLGDRLYGLGVAAPAISKRLAHHMLHASGLQFTDPVNGNKIRAASGLPKDFRACLRALKLR